MPISESEMTDRGGRLTPMRRYLNMKLGIAVDPAWRELEALADSFALPREWIVCPHCGSYGWRVPPHGFNEPCPVVMSMSEVAGLKFDAERSSAVRLGVHMEEMTRALRQMTEEEDEE